jgi:hypothetical protein
MKIDAETSSSANSVTRKNFGTPKYSAPEILRGESVNLKGIILLTKTSCPNNDEKCLAYSKSNLLRKRNDNETCIYKKTYKQLESKHHSG